MNCDIFYAMVNIAPIQYYRRFTATQERKLPYAKAIDTLFLLVISKFHATLSSEEHANAQLHCWLSLDAAVERLSSTSPQTASS